MREQAGIGIGTIALVAPADAGNAGIDRGERIEQLLRDLPPSGDEDDAS